MIGTTVTYHLITGAASPEALPRRRPSRLAAPAEGHVAGRFAIADPHDGAVRRHRPTEGALLDQRTCGRHGGYGAEEPPPHSGP